MCGGAGPGPGVKWGQCGGLIQGQPAPSTQPPDCSHWPPQPPPLDRINSGLKFNRVLIDVKELVEVVVNIINVLMSKLENSNGFNLCVDLQGTAS